LDWQASVLGFGVRYLPRLAQDRASIDEDKAARMLHYAIDRGVNYLDLPYLYDAGQRKNLGRFIGRALQGSYREKVMLASEMPTAQIKSADDFKRYLDAQLQLLQIDHLDFFLIAGLNRETWPALPARKVLRHAEFAMAAGRLGHLGFSFHDDFQTLKVIIDAYDNWTLSQFQYSFMDIDHHPGISGIKYAAARGLAVVVAEPLKRGRLTRRLPASVASIWKTLPKYSSAGWAFRWIWNHPEVTTVISDMASPAQVRENIALADQAAADSLTVPEELAINLIRDAYFKLKAIPCTACRGCMPCPMGIDVPRIFELYNDAMMYSDKEIPRSLYRDEGHRLQDCNECGRCLKACGRNIPITTWLKKADRLLNVKK
jgi:predicted aldo/keto reductase-like oxidoreductase